MFCSLHFNRELANEIFAVRHKVILACAWELIKVPIECLEVEVSPHATGVDDMISGTNWNTTKENAKTYMFTYSMLCIKHGFD